MAGLLMAAVVLCGWDAAAQGAVDAKELAEYRLTRPVFERFARATRLIVAGTRNDTRFVRDPLFTREITVAGDAVEGVALLQKRLETEPVLAGALFAAEMEAREYAKFALTLFAARLAHGFMESGALRRVPPGAAAENVAFVAAHEADVSALMRLLELER